MTLSSGDVKSILLARMFVTPAVNQICESGGPFQCASSSQCKFSFDAREGLLYSSDEMNAGAVQSPHGYRDSRDASSAVLSRPVSQAERSLTSGRSICKNGSGLARSRPEIRRECTERGAVEERKGTESFMAVVSEVAVPDVLQTGSSNIQRSGNRVGSADCDQASLLAELDCVKTFASGAWRWRFDAGGVRFGSTVAKGIHQRKGFVLPLFQ
jgi:hypothetical protein